MPVKMISRDTPTINLDPVNENCYRLCMTTSPRLPLKPDRQTAPSAARAANRISSAELMRGSAELLIEHDGREYRLRITQQGKLILTA